MSDSDTVSSQTEIWTAGQGRRPPGPSEKAGNSYDGRTGNSFKHYYYIALIPERLSKIIPVLFVTAGFGVIGFLDDYIKIVMKRSEGLNPGQKLAGQIIITGIFAYYIITSDEIGTQMLIPFTGQYLVMPVWLFVPALFFIVLGTDNGVNFTDGLDGLCTSVTILVATFFTIGYR